MRILDIGCGGGDVSRIAARLVGPDGLVLGLDRADEALQSAREKTKEPEYRHVRFERADFLNFFAEEKFDAIVGRFVLLHAPDAELALKHLKESLRIGGLFIFIELDLSTAGVFPAMPLFDKAVSWITESYRRDGVEVDMGSRLYGLFRSAQLIPELQGTVHVDAGEEAHAYQYLADTVRSLLPRITALGVADPDEVDVDTLAARLKQQSLAGNHCFFYPRMIAAWARLT